MKWKWNLIYRTGRKYFRKFKILDNLFNPFNHQSESTYTSVKADLLMEIVNNRTKCYPHHLPTLTSSTFSAILRQVQVDLWSDCRCNFDRFFSASGAPKSNYRVKFSVGKSEVVDWIWRWVQLCSRGMSTLTNNDAGGPLFS
ncbi:unnamed protein product [Phyllotreta striolata]|uniref:Uncharacterized protein n=1 Tax=Phyllotreta striolata TaxID=444603 RepID=A0A9N9XT78_PHYSR|nr:unnamed protein product [Phyllotreta striolata]